MAATTGMKRQMDRSVFFPPLSVRRLYDRYHFSKRLMDFDHEKPKLFSLSFVVVVVFLSLSLYFPSIVPWVCLSLSRSPRKSRRNLAACRVSSLEWRLFVVEEEERTHKNWFLPGIWCEFSFLMTWDVVASERFLSVALSGLNVGEAKENYATPYEKECVIYDGTVADCMKDAWFTYTHDVVWWRSFPAARRVEEAASPAAQSGQTGRTGEAGKVGTRTKGTATTGAERKGITGSSRRWRRRRAPEAAA